MQRTWLWVLALAGACKSHDRKPPPPRADAPATVDFAHATYPTIDGALEAGDAARGQLAVITIARDEIRANDFTAFSCGATKYSHRFFLTIPDPLRDRIRALPRRAPASGGCPRALIRIRSIGTTGYAGHAAADGGWTITPDAERLVMADTLAIDVAPVGPTAATAGVQLASIDDIVLSKFRGGELAEVPLRYEPMPGIDRIYMRSCDPSQGQEIEFPDEPLATSKLSGVRRCHAVRLRLRARPGPTLGGQMLEADLISIGAELTE